MDRYIWTLVVLAWLWVTCALVGCDMPKTDYGISGLATAPNPQGGAPPGALSKADNCVIRRVGMIEPRPGFKAGTDTTLAAIWKLIPFDGDFFAVGTAGATKWSNSTAADAVFDKHYARGCEARKNLYLTTSDSVRKFTAALDTTADRAGLQQPPGASVTFGTGTNLADTYSYAWRYLIRRTDANGVIVRSAPSGRSILYNNAGSTKNATARCYLGVVLGYVAGDVVELYRSYGSTVVGTPSDDLFLVAEHTITAADVTAMFADIVDSRTDVQLGAALYTNSTQEGIERANIPPPRARDLALFNGSLFAADITYPHTLTESFDQHQDLSGVSAGVGTRTYTGTRTHGSNQITGMSSIVGLRFGQLAENAISSWTGTDTVRIVSAIGTTLTMSETWNGATDGAPASLTFSDAIRIKYSGEDKYYPISAVLTAVGAITTDILTAFRFTHSAYINASSEGDGATFDASGTLAVTRATLQLTQLLPTSGQFSVWATHGDFYDPVLPEPDAASGSLSTQDAFPNGLAWSKDDEPEHFMSGQIWLVGNAKAPILRVVPLKDALLVFKGKGDGIYKLTGFGELTGWNVQQLDPSAYLLHPELVTVSGGETDVAAFAWTNVGASRVTSEGAQVLSNAILDLVGQQQRTLDSSAAVHAFAFAATNLPDNEILWGLPSSDTDDQAPANTWVYNTVTNAWTEWYGAEGSPNTMTLNPKSNLLLSAGQGHAGIPGLARNATAEDVVNGDFATNVTVTASVGLAVTIAGASGWTPAVGDILHQGAAPFVYVTAITDATHFTVDTAIATGGWTADRAFLSTVTWLPKVDPTGAVLKQFQDVVLHWDDVFGLYAFTVSFSGTRGNTLNRVYSRAGTRSHVRAETRAMLDATVALDQQLYITLKVLNADARWRISGVSENALIASTRVAR